MSASAFEVELDDAGVDPDAGVTDEEPLVHPMQVFSAGMLRALALAELDESLSALELLGLLGDDVVAGTSGARGTGTRL